jgi:hypothetical protein
LSAAHFNGSDRANGKSSAISLPPAGPKTVAAKLEKGWIERLPDSAVPVVRIAEAGQAVFKAKIPEKR